MTDKKIMSNDELAYALTQNLQYNELYIAQIELIKQNKFDMPALHGFPQTDMQLEQYLEKRGKNSSTVGKSEEYIQLEQDLINLIYNLYKNQRENPAKNAEFWRFWNFISPIFVNEYNMLGIKTNADIIKFILSQLDNNIQNQPTIYALLKYTVDRLQGQDRKDVSVRIANSEYATMVDKITAFMRTDNKEIARDALELSKKELKQALSEQNPDINKIKNICVLVLNYLHRHWADKYPEDTDILNSISEEFNLKKISDLGATYIAQFEESLEEKASKSTKLQTEIEKLNREKTDNENIIQNKNSQIQTMQQQIQQLQQQLQQEQKKNQLLNGQLDVLQRTTEKQKRAIDGIQKAAEETKGGLFAGGNVKVLQDKIMEQVRTLDRD